MLVERRKSPIHGNGVFARAFVEEGDWQYVYGEIVPSDHPLEHFCVEADEGMYLPYPPFRWLNHNRPPNCELVWDEIDGYTIEALRDIQPDEELTMDYGFTP